MKGQSKGVEKERTQAKLFLEGIELSTFALNARVELAFGIKVVLYKGDALTS